MTTIVLDLPAFRAYFPEFSSSTKYPDATIQMYWDAGTNYIETTWEDIFLGDARSRALDLMAAHLIVYSQKATVGKAAGPVQQTSIHDVSVTMASIPAKNAWQFWLMSTPYGVQLFALLQASSAGGLYVGGWPEGSGFRRFGGGFP